MSSLYKITTIVATVALISLFTPALAQTSDGATSACNGVLNRSLSYLKSAGTRLDSFNRAYTSVESLKHELATACAAIAKDAGSGAVQCARAGGAWNANRSLCEHFNNNIDVFGGTVDYIIPCYNQAFYFKLANGRGVVWTKETKSFGPTFSEKQFVMGVTDKDYFCIAQKVPVIVWRGTHIMSMAHRAYSPSDESRAHADRVAADARNRDELNKKIESFSGQLSAAPKDASVLTARGEAYLKKIDYSHAIADFNEVVALRQNDPAALSNRCWARVVANQDIDKAQIDAKEALRLKPKFVDALNCSGLINLRLGHFDMAIADYDELLDIREDFNRGGGGNWNTPTAWYGRGLAEMQRHNEAAAVLDLAVAKAIVPEIVEQFEGYGFRLSRQPIMNSKQVQNINPILMAPLFDAYVELFYKRLSDRTRNVSARTLVDQSINGMLEAATLSDRDVDVRKICGAGPLPGSRSEDEVSESLKCFLLVLNQTTKRFAPEEDLDKYYQIFRGAIYGLKNAAN